MEMEASAAPAVLEDPAAAAPPVTAHSVNSEGWASSEGLAGLAERAGLVGRGRTCSRSSCAEVCIYIVLRLDGNSSCLKYFRDIMSSC